MAIELRITGIKQAKWGIRYLINALETGGPRQTVLLNRLGRAFRDQSRQHITDQSYGGQKWAPLSKWTKARTGRNKALLKQRERIIFRTAPGRLEVGYREEEAGWNLTKHHKGFRTLGVTGKLMRVPLVRPTALNPVPKGNAKFFTKSKAAVVPARPIWPDRKMIGVMGRPIVTQWMQENIRKMKP